MPSKALRTKRIDVDSSKSLRVRRLKQKNTILINMKYPLPQDLNLRDLKTAKPAEMKKKIHFLCKPTRKSNTKLSKRKHTVNNDIFEVLDQK